MSDRNNDKELFDDNNLNSDDKAEQLERYIEQMKEE
ncbi:MAG: hypothetical protein K0Q65_3137, partial [Clostridia bacterium]|nr:hypothetical protein [Clostridia bacterium]